MSIAFAIQIIPQVFASAAVLFYSIKESFLTISNSERITKY